MRGDTRDIYACSSAYANIALQIYREAGRGRVGGEKRSLNAYLITAPRPSRDITSAGRLRSPLSLFPNKITLRAGQRSRLNSL